MRVALPIVVVVVALLAVGCGGGGGNDDDNGRFNVPTVAPVPTDGWLSFNAPSGCLSLSFPSNWQLKTMGDLEGTGKSDCPGGEGITNEVVECDPSATGAVLAIARAQLADSSSETGLAAWVELHGAVKRCATLEDHLRMIVISSGGSVIEGPQGEVAGREASCVIGKRMFSDRTFDVHVCLAEIEGKLYLLTTTWDTERRDELEPIAETIARSLRIDPVD